MPSEVDEIVVNYFVLCDSVITEAQTNKQSLIGIYSNLASDQFPMNANISVAFSARLQSARQREFIFIFTGPDGAVIFKSPPLPFDQRPLESSLRASGFANIQMGLQLRAVPFAKAGIYQAGMYCDEDLIASAPIAVSQQAASK